MMNRIPFAIVTRLVRVGSYFLVNPHAHNEMFLDGEWTCICMCCEMSQNTLKRSRKIVLMYSGVPRNFVRGGSTNSVEERGQRERGSGGCSPLVRGSGGSCNLLQEISFHIVKFS